MQVSEIMKSDVACVREGHTIVEAAQLMRDKNIGFLPVCDEANHVLGTITDRDIVIRCAADGMDPSACKVEQVFTREVVASKPEDDLAVAEELMARYQKSRIIVVDDQDILCGVVSLSDIAQHAGLSDGGKTLRYVTSREARSN